MAAKELSPEELEELRKKMGGADKVKRKPDDFPKPASIHNAKLVPLFEEDDKNNVWTVRGSFPVIPYVFSLTSTMTIHRCEKTGQLTVFNAFRCSENLEKEILELGPIANVVKLGQFHGDADAYYTRAPQFDNPKLWTLPGGSVAEGTSADEILSETNLPMDGAKLYHMKEHPFPEGLVTVPCACASGGPLLVATDSLIHIPDLSIVQYVGRFIFYLMGWNMQSEENVPKPAPMWCQMTVQAVGADCVRRWYQEIAAMEWNSFVGSHGVPAKNVNHDAMRQGVLEQIIITRPK